MKKTTIIAVLTAIAKNATCYDDFTDRVEYLEKALGKGWMLMVIVDDDVTDPDDPQWYTVNVYPPKGREYEVDLTEYLKGVE